jgi:uncharacterized protein
VTPERLLLVENGESILRELGFRQFRVRLHDKLARIEVAVEELSLAMTAEMGAAIAQRFKAVGFLYVALDLEGYRQGSLNAALLKNGNVAMTERTKQGRSSAAPLQEGAEGGNI